MASPEAKSSEIARQRAPSWFSALAVGLALLFVVYQWCYSGGFPYIRDGNESALSFVHALNLKLFNPVKSSFLTTFDTEFDKPAPHPNYIYTHNPNFPRYLHYGLLLLGIDSFTTHVLLVTFAVTILNVLSLQWLLRETLGDGARARWLALVPIFALVTDYLGFLSFTVNTYRTFCFCLLWLGLLAVRKPWGFARTFALFFVLCQLEYGFAAFVLSASLVYWLISSRPGGVRPVFAMTSGACTSLLLYFVQLRSRYPLEFILHDIHATAERRGGGLKASSYLNEALPAFLSRLKDIQVPPQNWLLAWALCSATLTMFQAVVSSDLLRIRRALAGLFIALVAGGVMGSLVMTNYFYEAFFGGILPFLTFFNVIATGIFVCDCLALVDRVGASPLARIVLAASALVLALAPMAWNSLRWWQAYPGLQGGYVHLLKHEYRGKPIMVMSHFNQVPTAMTWGPTLHLTDAESTFSDSNYSRFERFRDHNGNLTLLCLKLRWVGFDALLSKLEARGDEILQRGPDFAFIQIKGPAFLRTDSSFTAPTSSFGALRLRIAPSPTADDRRIPLLAAGNSKSGSLVYFRYAGRDTIRVGLDAGARGELVTPPFKIDLTREQIVEISLGSLYPPVNHPKMISLESSLSDAMRRVLLISWNTHPIIEAALPLPAIAPAAILIGESSDFPDTTSKFTGKILAIERWWPTSRTLHAQSGRGPNEAFGPLAFEVEFPRGAAGRTEPLVTSGLTGAGDFIYVRYIDDEHVRFGFDHWGVHGFLGDPVKISSGQRHRLKISMGSLYPPANDPWFAGQSGHYVQTAKNHVSVFCDDLLVLSAESSAYESPASFIRIGENSIGGSTTSSAFSGAISTTHRLTPIPSTSASPRR